MKRITVEGINKSGYDLNNRINFSLLSSPKNGRRQIRCFESCRDYINDCMISFYNYNGKDKRGRWDPETDAPLDINYTRLLIAKSTKNYKETVQRIYSAKRIINMYEDLTDWKRRSVLARVEHNDSNVKYCWALTGPGQWMKSSHLISMITLIFRVVDSNGDFEDMTTLDQVERRLKRLCELKGSLDLDSYLPVILPKLRMLMVRYNELFGNFSYTECNPPEEINSWHNTGGIVSLCSEKTGVASIDNRFRKEYELWKEKEQLNTD